MHRDPFAYSVVRADAKEAPAITEAEILGVAAENRTFVDNVSGPERRKSFYHSMCADIIALTNLRVFLDYRIRSYLYAGTEPGAGVDDGCRVNVHGRSILTCEFWLEYCCPLTLLIVCWVNRTRRVLTSECPYSSNKTPHTNAFHPRVSRRQG